MNTPLLTASQVAAVLQMHVNRFYAQRRMLEDQHGFPAPVCGLGLRWRPEAIDRWLDRAEIESCSPGMVVERMAMAANDSGDAMLAEAQAEMDRRAAGMRRVG